MSLKKKGTAAVVATSVLFVASCQTMSDIGDSVTESMNNMGISKEDLGTAIGVVGGALAGSYFGGGKGKYLAIAAGALLGGYLGKTIGANLDEADRAAVAQQSAVAFEHAKDGEAIQWSNPDTKASAILKPTNTRTETRSVKIARSKAVQAPGPMALIGKPYVVTGSSVNVRSGPSTGNAVVGSVKEGEIYNAVGRIENSEWILVSSKGKSFGYVHGSLLAPASDAQIATELDKRLATKQVASAEPAATASDAAPSDQGAIDLDAMDLDGMAPTLRESEAVDLDAMFADDADVVVEETQVATQCRELQAAVTTPKDTSEGNFTACKAPDGAWELG